MRAYKNTAIRTPDRTRRSGRRTTFVFDLDGTLIDSAGDIAIAANRVLADYGAAPLPSGRVVKMVGGGAPKLLERAFAAAEIPLPPMQEAMDSFLAHYHTGPEMTTKPYPGVTNLLTALRRAGNPVALCTNKPGRATWAILTRLGWDGLFDAVVAGDDLPEKKPNAMPVLTALALAGGVREKALYVGDSFVDVMAARNAHLPVVVLTHGYAHSPVSGMGADAMLTTVRPLLGLAGS